MIKYFLFYVTLAAGFITFNTSASYSQDLPNGDFEKWLSSGKEPPFDWMEPEGWTSNNAVVEFIGAAVTRAGASTNYYCSIKTQNLFGNNVPGILCLGKPKLNFQTYSVDFVSGGMPLSDIMPGGLRGRYKFTSSDNNDKAIVVILMKKYNTEKGIADTIRIKTAELKVNNTFENFTVELAPFIYHVVPDSIVVAFISGNPEDAKSGSVLLLDDVHLDYESGIADRTNANNNRIAVFPNPATDNIHFNANIAALKECPVRIMIFNQLGEKLQEKRVENFDLPVDVSMLPPGFYTIRVSISNHEETGTFIIK